MLVTSPQRQEAEQTELEGRVLCELSTVVVGFASLLDWKSIATSPNMAEKLAAVSEFAASKGDGDTTLFLHGLASALEEKDELKDAQYEQYMAQQESLRKISSRDQVGC